MYIAALNILSVTCILCLYTYLTSIVHTQLRVPCTWSILAHTYLDLFCVLCMYYKAVYRPLHIVCVCVMVCNVMLQLNREWSGFRSFHIAQTSLHLCGWTQSTPWGGTTPSCDIICKKVGILGYKKLALLCCSVFTLTKWIPISLRPHQVILCY